MEVWISLVSAVIGGLIAVIPVLITIRNQSIEREKERQEQRREAKTQLALELARNDVKIIEESIDNTLKALNSVHNLAFKRDVGKLSHKQMIEELKSALMGENKNFYRLVETDLITDKLAYTFGDEFNSQFIIWDELMKDYFDMLLSEASMQEKLEKLPDLRNEIINIAAKLHSMMNEKLISIRDTES